MDNRERKIINNILEKKFIIIGTVNISDKRYKLIFKNAKLTSTLNNEGDYSDELVKWILDITGAEITEIPLEKIVAELKETGWFGKKILAGINGKKMWIFVEWHLSEDDKDETIITISDIDAEERHAIANAERVEEASSSFLANISHEIRTPMNTILGLSEIMLRENVPDNMRSDLIAIQNAGSGLLSVINDVLDLSKINSDKFKIEEKKYRLIEIITSASNMTAIQLNKKDVLFYLAVNPDVPTDLIGDGLRVKQVLLNLLSNAVKFTEQGYIRLEISVAKKEGKRVLLKFCLTDTGVGISEENRKHLFEKYFQVNDNGHKAKKGTGLGLNISRTLAKMMEGDIEVSSTVGQGSEFTFTVWQKYEEETRMLNSRNVQKIALFNLDGMAKKIVVESLERLNVQFDQVDKLDSTDAQYVVITEQDYYNSQACIEKRKEQFIVIADYYRRGMHVTSENVVTMYLHIFSLQMMRLMNGEEVLGSFKQDTFDIANAADFSQRRILAVDDNITNLYVIKGLLNPYKCIVDFAVSGCEAIMKVKETEYDLVFMDQMMPEMDGIETLKHINEGGTRKFPVIALTAVTGEDAREKLIREGFDDYLVKPINVGELDRIMNEQLNAGNEGIDARVGNLEIEKVISSFYFDVDSYKKILKIFQSELWEKRKAADEALKEKNYKNFMIVVHGIKSAAKEVGAFNLSECALKLEDLSKNNKGEEIDKLYPKFIEYYDETMESIDLFSGK